MPPWPMEDNDAVAATAATRAHRFGMACEGLIACPWRCRREDCCPALVGDQNVATVSRTAAGSADLRRRGRARAYDSVAGAGVGAARRTCCRGQPRVPQHVCDVRRVSTAVRLLGARGQTSVAAFA